MEVVKAISLAMGSAWASGINLYATVFMLGLLHNTGNIQLPPQLHVVAQPMVMFAAAVMYVIEFFADKVPGVDTGWDALHTFIRIPAGAVLAAGALGQTSQAAELAGYILGGGLAATSHGLKAGSRVIINASPEPFTNWAASIGEDLTVLAGLYCALHYPLLFLALLVLFLALMVWLAPRLWRGIKKMFATLGRWLGLSKPPPPIAPPLAAQGAGAAPPPGSHAEVGAMLDQLESLNAQGKLSPEEYADMRGKLLAKLT